MPEAEGGSTDEAEAALDVQIVIVLLSRVTAPICAKASPQIIVALVFSVILSSARMSPMKDVDVPSVAENLVPDYDVVSWLGFTAPADLPPAVRDRWHAAFRQSMARPAVKDKLEELGNDTRVSTPAEFRTRVETDMSRWRPLAHVVSQL